jgi:ribosome-binding factor A
VLGELILALKDPRVGFVTVTGVRVTPDLRLARVAVSVLGDDDARKASLAGLESAKPVLRAELGRQMRMKYLPDLVFELDEGADRAERIEQLLHEIHQHEEGRPRPDSENEEGRPRPDSESEKDGEET